jgi:hypothetical protein
MEIQAIIKKECPIPEGFSGVSLKGHTVVVLPLTSFSGARQPNFLYDYIRLKIHAESGGGATNTGSAAICTDLQGQLLPGFKQVTGGSGKFSYGHVFVAQPFMEITVDRHGYEITANITKMIPMFQPERKILWKYNDDLRDVTLPGTLEKDTDALQAAISKSQCYHCHCLHFYNTEG